MFAYVALNTKGNAPPMPQIALVTDKSKAEPYLPLVLSQYGDIRQFGLNTGDCEHAGDPELIVFACDLSDDSSLRHIRSMSAACGQDSARLFVLPKADRRLIVQAYALGAHDVIAHPLSRAQIDSVVTPLIKGADAHWESLTAIQLSALKISLRLFERTHKNPRVGDALTPDATLHAARLVIEATRQDGLAPMLEALRSHHNYTFRHSMFVAGTLVSFADLLGFRAADVELLSAGGLLHDIGKIEMPLALLDKTGKLTESEWGKLKDHPSAGACLLRREDGWAPEVIDAALHHHERVDGRGYPDALSGAPLSDVARIVAIADAFSALIDKRAYKAPMPADTAYQMMRQSEGHFDPDLLDAFEAVAHALKPRASASPY